MGDRLATRTAIVIGAARGIGAAVALRLHQEGARVVVADVEPQGEATARALDPDGHTALFVHCDVGRPDDVSALVETTLARLGRVDVLVQNAGIFPWTLIENIEVEEWDRVLAVNLRGAFVAAKACLEPMKRQRYGRMVFTSSITGPRVSSPGHGHYSASKAGINGFIRAAALEFAPFGITVNGVEPGNILTEGAQAHRPASYMEAMKAAVPLGRLGTPRDVANACLFLASDEADYVTGHDHRGRRRPDPAGEPGGGARPGSRRRAVTDPGPARARPLLAVEGVGKRFGTVTALEDVAFEVHPGEVVALLGDNGAGKSTLIKIISGSLQPDTGRILLDGREVRFDSPSQAKAAGIETVYQDLSLCLNMDTVANFFMGRERFRSVLGFHVLDERAMQAETEQALAEIGTEIPSVRTSVEHLSGGQRQAIELGRFVHWGGKLVLLDEPFAALGVEQTRRGLELIDRIRRRGVAVIVITHNLLHAFQVADRVVVLRRGRVTGMRTVGGTTPEEVVMMITGELALQDA